MVRATASEDVAIYIDRRVAPEERKVAVQCCPISGCSCVRQGARGGYSVDRTLSEDAVACAVLIRARNNRVRRHGCMPNGVRRHGHICQRSERGPSVQTRSVYAGQPHQRIWPYASKDDTACMRQPGLRTWLLCARCPVFKCTPIIYIYCVQMVTRRSETYVYMYTNPLTQSRCAASASVEP